MYNIRVQSKIFWDLYHLEEVDLFCHERINFEEFDREILMANQNKTKYPPTIDQWTCCDLTWAKFSDTVLHIEKDHLPYVLESTNSAFKHTCPKCKTQYMAYSGLVNHFIKNHVEHHLRCLQCIEKFGKLEDYCAHATNCNLSA